MTDETTTPNKTEANVPDNSTTPDTEVEAPIGESLDMAFLALQAERDQLFETLARSQAEFDNIRKRQQREAEQEAKYRAMPIVRDILPGLDNMRRSLEAANKGGKLEDLTKGVEMTLKQFEELLARFNAVPIPGAGTPFDPNLHQAISQAPSAEHPPMTVLMEVEKGYVMHDRVVRPSKVIVSIAPQS
jgi:molecular chaperone GrpE